MNLDIYLDEIAYKCFRDVADEDYICARMAFKAGLCINFHWLSLQSIEKYLKCILLLNRKKAKFGHDLKKGLKDAKKLKFLHLDEDAINFIDYINKYGSPSARYFENSIAITPPMLKRLDKAIFSIRNLCTKNIDQSLFREKQNVSEPQRFNKLEGGFLEKVLNNEWTKESKDSLIWCNYYCNSTEEVKMTHFCEKNTPNTYLLPKDEESRCRYITELGKYIFISVDK
jgi:HEPN domain-containing protein